MATGGGEVGAPGLFPLARVSGAVDLDIINGSLGTQWSAIVADDSVIAQGLAGWGEENGGN